MKKPRILDLLGEALSHPDARHLPPAGNSLSGANTFLAAPTTEVKVQSYVSKGAWSEIDCLAPDRWMRIHVFGNSTSMLGMAAVEYFDADHKLSFDAPGWHAHDDMLLMVATGKTSNELASKLWGATPQEPPRRLTHSVTKPVLALARAFQKQDFMGQLEQTARARNRQRLYMHVEGDSQRYQQLTRGLGFTTKSVQGATLFLKMVGSDNVS